MSSYLAQQIARRADLTRIGEKTSWLQSSPNSAGAGIEHRPEPV